MFFMYLLYLILAHKYNYGFVKNTQAKGERFGNATIGYIFFHSIGVLWIEKNTLKHDPRILIFHQSMENVCGLIIALLFVRFNHIYMW